MEYSEVNVTQEDFYNVTNILTTNVSLNESVKYRFKSGNKTTLYEIEDWVAGLLYFAYSSICTTALIGNLVVLWLILVRFCAIYIKFFSKVYFSTFS